MWLRSFITSHCNEFFDLFKLTFRNGGKTFKIPTSSAATLANAFDGAGLGFCSRSLRRVTASTPSEAGGRGNPGDRRAVSPDRHVAAARLFDTAAAPPDQNEDSWELPCDAFRGS